MKKIVILLFALFVNFCMQAQTTPPTGASTTTTTVEEVKSLKIAVAQIQTDLKKAGIPQENLKVTTEEKTFSFQQKFVILLPIGLFFICLFITFLFARKDNFNFRKSFYSDDPQQITIQTDPINNPKDTISITLLVNGMPVYQPSVSRIIAFISSLTTLAVIVCFISYYGYCMLSHKTLPVFDNLFEIIFGLGLGILPYGFNRISENKKTTSLT